MGVAPSWAGPAEIVYDASLGTLPSSQGWTYTGADPFPVDGLVEANYSVAGGILTQGPTGGPNDDDANIQFYEPDAFDFNFEHDEVEVTIRAHVLASTYTLPGSGQPRAGFGAFLVDAAGRDIYMGIARGFVFIGASNGNGPTATAHDTLGGFSDYTLRVSSTGAVLLIDGDPVAELALDEFGTSAANLLRIGDVSASHRGSTELESIRIVFGAPSVAEVREIEMVSAIGTNVTQNGLATTALATASCPSGSHVVGGGVKVTSNDGGQSDIVIYESAPFPASVPNPTSWRAQAHDAFGPQEPFEIQVDVLCGEVPGQEVVSAEIVSTSNALSPGTAICPAGKVALGAGSRVLGLYETAFVELRPDGIDRDHSDVLIRTKEWGDPDPLPSWTRETFAICADDADWIVKADSTPIDTTHPKSYGVACPIGTVLVGGGAEVLGNNTVSLQENGPVVLISGPPVVWSASAVADPNEPASAWGLGVIAICAPEADPTIPKHSLVGRWNADSGFPADERGDSDGTLVNGASIAPGLSGQAFSLDRNPGSPEWVSIPEDSLFPTADFTVDAWIQTSSLAPGLRSMIATMYVPGGPESSNNWSTWLLRLTEDGFAEAGVRGPTNGQQIGFATGDVDLADGAPHHLAFARRRVGTVVMLELYVDGGLVESVQLGGLQATPPTSAGYPDPISIGVLREYQGPGFEQLFDGLIDDVKIYHRALEPAELEQIAGCGLPLPLPRVINLDATRFGGDSQVPERHKLCIQLEAGDYVLELVEPGAEPAAAYAGWYEPASDSWNTRVRVDPEVDSDLTLGLMSYSTSAAAAFAAAPKLTPLSLSAPQKVFLGVEGSSGLIYDNQGGQSIRISVPEPGFLVGLGVGVGGLALFQRRRRRGRIVRR